MRHWLSWLAVAGLWGFALASSARETVPPVFERLESLAGEWEADVEGGDTVRSSYRLIANKTAVMETLNDAAHQDMTTIYHPDGEGLAATHYCSSDNQPRMRARTAGDDEDSLAFETVSVTNLKSPGARHIRAIVFRFEDEDHFTQEWTQREDGVDSVDVLHFVRKR